jgi:hypothetical protein
VISHILTFGREDTQKYLCVDRGSENPLYLSHPQTKRRKISPIQYEPDVYFTTKKKSKIVFEILDSEYKKTSEIISDMIQCCLGSSVVLLVLVVPVRDQQVEKRILDTYEVIAGTLIYLKVNKEWIPNLAVCPILLRESVSYAKTRRVLAKLQRTAKF